MIGWRARTGTCGPEKFAGDPDAILLVGSGRRWRAGQKLERLSALMVHLGHPTRDPDPDAAAAARGLE